MTTITDIEVSLYTSNPDNPRCCLHWKQGDHRFHIWFADLHALKFRKLTKDDTLYKNSLYRARVTPSRSLNPLAKCNAATVYEARRFAVEGCLYNKARAEQAAENAENKRIVEQEARDHRVKEHGLELLAALELAVATIERLTSTDSNKRASVEETLDVASVAIAKAKEG